MRAALLDRFGMFGIRLAIVLIRSGIDDPTELARDLARRSGLGELQRLLDAQFQARAAQLKARTTLVGLEALLRERPRPGAERLAAEVERVQAGAHEFRELRLLATARTSGLPVPAALVAGGRAPRGRGGGRRRAPARTGRRRRAGGAARARTRRPAPLAGAGRQPADRPGHGRRLRGGGAQLRGARGRGRRGPASAAGAAGGALGGGGSRSLADGGDGRRGGQAWAAGAAWNQRVADGVRLTIQAAAASSSWATSGQRTPAPSAPGAAR